MGCLDGLGAGRFSEISANFVLLVRLIALQFVMLLSVLLHE